MKVINIKEWHGQLTPSPHIKARVWMESSQFCCKRDRRSLFLTCLRFFVPAWRLGMFWHQVKVVFIPKPGRNCYCGPRDFRPISLTSFLLKTMERLVDG